ncbi:Glyoxalase family protein [Sulfitobacter noctilucicola]|uniref:Catechol 2,3-dioxygenase-like lactoylglutathione lyase family enzyme n=1 Tax=Sulfitobacter noctilucicola TaxID=1342301 RepID=A0A7W6M886_9RHOB|nr:VOC family protein [Sulfitobacter noctilucicola]KIN64562.1 Glyoxalase family protein [Sulfitobacter noctilucicola]MBB4174283.1 catechol 2,3-dioxygenase-like lactoylglutathione lyase family enzyme [Sulfitobacter noctilucicola]
MQLSALTLIIPDYDEAIAYYTRTLGFTLIDDIDQGSKRWVRIAPSANAQTGIILAEPSTPAQRSAIGTQGAGRVWLFLQTQDFAADHARMTKAGVTFEEEPRQEVYGTVAVFADKFGNRWDLIEYA